VGELTERPDLLAGGEEVAWLPPSPPKNPIPAFGHFGIGFRPIWPRP